MKPIEAYFKIREACLRRPELKHKIPVDDPIIFPHNPYLGFCYVSTLAFCHFIPDATHYRDKTGTHHWAQIGNKIWDLTAEQFNFIFPYEEGQKVRRKHLPSRAQELVKEVLNEQ